MALNPDTGIDYETDRFVRIFVPDLAVFDLANPATYNVIEWSAKWPRTDGAALSGANPQFQFYKRVVTEKPGVDHRYQIITTQHLVSLSPAPAEGLPVGTYSQTHTPQKFDDETLKAQVETAFQSELRKRFPDSANPAVLLEAADAITRKQNGAALTDEQQTVLDTVVGVGDAVAQLRAKQAEFNAAIDAGLDYDLSDWEIAE
jgi:hypothetical protein